MDALKGKNNAEQGGFAVTDPQGVLIFGVSLIVALLFELFLAGIIDKPKDGFLERLIAGLVCGGLALVINSLLMYRIRALLPGVRLDLELGEISFPGGGLAANGVFDYVRPKFWMQYLDRIVIKTDQVTQIGLDARWKKVPFLGDKDGERRVWTLRLDGDFGSTGIDFSNKKKAEQAYGQLAAYLEAGSPVVVR
ncbi:hypothetical protein [Inhella gelatinilytica]|uniref:Uncharacterized protein n=1 Tax=Inhella gelatinilytica TaxID=2795030 RepID=A0A931NDI1_9BURK|nr:hypothetical protein [Inhella gelatinilytica]MBH9552260.1 hypothetical protein [Inhella gelatinilytica]